jgi:hypothetical protein
MSPGQTQYGGALMDAAVLRAASSDIGGAVHAARAAIHRAAHTGNRPDTTDAVAIAVIGLASSPDRLDAAATVDGVRHCPVLGHIPAIYASIHQSRIDAAREHVITTLDADADAYASARGAARPWTTTRSSPTH